MSKRLVKILFLEFLLTAKIAQGSTLCLEEVFAGSSAEENRDGTDDLIAYMGTLLEERIISEDELIRFTQELEAGELVNPISEKKGGVDSGALLHHRELQEYLDETVLDHKVLLKWAKKNLKERGLEKIQREETRANTEEFHQRMEFFPILPGTFDMGENLKISVELTHDIEMMSTLVTQKHWLDLMGENPSRFKGPDHPVESVSWWSVIEFANRLSIKHGLTPAYDTTGIEFSGRAEDGTRRREKGDLKINAPNNDIYLAEGYRLPTDAEHEYVRKKVVQGMDDLKNYAWFSKNSENSTHPVADLKPFVIDGNNFFDLYGNVSEWANDWFLLGTRPEVNPVGESLFTEQTRAVRGGSWRNHAQYFFPAYRHEYFPGGKTDFIGFRLVRTIK